MNENQVEGKYDKAKGEVKEQVGDVTDDTRLKAEGAWDKMKGGAKEAVGNIQDSLKKDNDANS